VSFAVQQLGLIPRSALWIILVLASGVVIWALWMLAEVWLRQRHRPPHAFPPVVSDVIWRLDKTEASEYVAVIYTTITNGGSLPLSLRCQLRVPARDDEHALSGTPSIIEIDPGRTWTGELRFRFPKELLSTLPTDLEAAMLANSAPASVSHYPTPMRLLMWDRVSNTSENWDLGQWSAPPRPHEDE